MRQRLVIIGMLIFDIGNRCGLLDSLNIFRCANLNGQDDFHHVLLDAVEHIGEELEGFAFVLLLRVFLRVAAQMDALAQVIEVG